MEKTGPCPEEYCSVSYVVFGYEDQPSSYSFNGPSGKAAGFSASGDSDGKRKKRIATYNSYMTENKLKSSVRNSFKWVKGKLTGLTYG